MIKRLLPHALAPLFSSLPRRWGAMVTNDWCVKISLFQFLIRVFYCAVFARWWFVIWFGNTQSNHDSWGWVLKHSLLETSEITRLFIAQSPSQFPFHPSITEEEDIKLPCRFDWCFLLIDWLSWKTSVQAKQLYVFGITVKICAQ